MFSADIIIKNSNGTSIRKDYVRVNFDKIRPLYKTGIVFGERTDEEEIIKVLNSLTLDEWKKEIGWLLSHYSNVESIAVVDGYDTFWEDVDQAEMEYLHSQK